MTRLYAFVQSFVAEARELESGQTMAEYAVVLGVITITIHGSTSFIPGDIISALIIVTTKL